MKQKPTYIPTLLTETKPTASADKHGITPPHNLASWLAKRLLLSLITLVFSFLPTLFISCEEELDSTAVIDLTLETTHHIPTRLQGEWSLLRLRPAGSYISTEFWSGTLCRITSDSLISFTRQLYLHDDAQGQLTADTVETIRQRHALQPLPTLPSSSDSLSVMIDNRHVALFRMVAGDSCIVSGTTDSGTWELVMGRIKKNN